MIPDSQLVWACMHVCEKKSELCPRGCVVFVLVLPAGSNNHTQFAVLAHVCLKRSGTIKFHSNCTRKLHSVVPGQLLRVKCEELCFFNGYFMIKVVQRVAHVCSNFFHSHCQDAFFLFCGKHTHAHMQACIHRHWHAFSEQFVLLSTCLYTTSHLAIIMM